MGVGPQAPQPITLAAEVRPEVAGVGADGGISDLERGGGQECSCVNCCSWAHASTVPVPAADLSSPILLPTPQARDHKDGGLDKAGGVGAHRPGDADSMPRAVRSLLPTPVADNSRGIPSTSTAYQSLANAVTDFGPYAPAIARWEAVLGRPAPSPTEPGKDDRPRLAPAFVEWMMGLPAGHVTDPAIGLSRAQQLKALGNGVVPQQATLALHHLT